MAIPAIRDLAKTANMSAREIEGQGRAAGAKYEHRFVPPVEPRAPKPKVEKLPKVSAYNGLFTKGRS